MYCVFLLKDFLCQISMFLLIVLGALKFQLGKDKRNIRKNGNGADFQDPAQFCANYACLDVLCWSLTIVKNLGIYVTGWKRSVLMNVLF